MMSSAVTSAGDSGGGHQVAFWNQPMPGCSHARIHRARPAGSGCRFAATEVLLLIIACFLNGPGEIFRSPDVSKARAAAPSVRWE